MPPAPEDDPADEISREEYELGQLRATLEKYEETIREVRAALITLYAALDQPTPSIDGINAATTRIAAAVN